MLCLKQLRGYVIPQAANLTDEISLRVQQDLQYGDLVPFASWKRSTVTFL
jgi:hypothetical protein